METDLRRILEHYDLGSLLTWRRAETGHVNDYWFVTTTRGRYFLKRRHPGLRHPGIIRPQQGIVAPLRQAGFPAPALVPTPLGDTLLVMGSECIEVQEVIEGHPYEHERPAHVEEAAAILRELLILGDWARDNGERMAETVRAVDGTIWG